MKIRKSGRPELLPGAQHECAGMTRTAETGCTHCRELDQEAALLFQGAKELHAAMSDRVRLLEAANAELMAALRGVLPYMEEAEKAGLVGHEGCHWPVEAVRVAIKSVTATN